MILRAFIVLVIALESADLAGAQPLSPRNANYTIDVKLDSRARTLTARETLVWTNKYLNNMIEQDHRRVKQRCYPMLWLKTFGNAEVILSGIELANKIKKGQFDTSEITGPGAMILQVWEAVLAA